MKKLLLILVFISVTVSFTFSEKMTLTDGMIGTRYVSPYIGIGGGFVIGQSTIDLDYYFLLDEEKGPFELGSCHYTYYFNDIFELDGFSPYAEIGIMLNWLDITRDFDGYGELEIFSRATYFPVGVGVAYKIDQFLLFGGFSYLFGGKIKTTIKDENGDEYNLEYDKYNANYLNDLILMIGARLVLEV